MSSQANGSGASSSNPNPANTSEPFPLPPRTVDPTHSNPPASANPEVQDHLRDILHNFAHILDNTAQARQITEEQRDATEQVLEQLARLREALTTPSEPRERRRSPSRGRSRTPRDREVPIHDSPSRIRRRQTPAHPTLISTSPTLTQTATTPLPPLTQPNPIRQTPQPNHVRQTPQIQTPGLPPYQRQQQVVYVPYTPTVQTEPTRTPTGHLRAPHPEFYDGDRNRGKAFMMACTNYISLCPGQFSGEQVMIQWCISFMTKGRALHFAQDVFDFQATGSMRFRDWTHFREEFMREFYPLAEEEAATNVLEGRSYFQGRRSMDDYIDTFKRLITQAGYIEPKGITVKFRRGLDPTIQEAINLMPFGRPSDNDPEAWYGMARHIYQARLTNAAFSSSSAPTFNRPFVNRATRPDPNPQFQQRPVPSFTNPPRSTSYRPPPPTQRERHPSVRFQTPSNSTYARSNNPAGVNIRSLTLDQLEALSAEIAAQRDTLELEQRHVVSRFNEEEEEDMPSDVEAVEQPPVATDEGFQNSEE